MFRNKQFVSIVAIVKDEEPFLDEWLVYHRMLGVDHFFLYDDDPRFPLQDYLAPHKAYVTVVPWAGMDQHLPGRMNQVKAYIHAVVKFGARFEWMGFIDIDEFVVLYQHDSLKDYLQVFPQANAVSLRWHVFGHNGFYDNPPGLVTSSLTRRMRKPGAQVKTFTRPHAIAYIESPHFCGLSDGIRVDANGRPFRQEAEEADPLWACINHYQCRSFTQWMHRVKRGDVNFKADNAPSSEQWRITEEACLRQFVTTVARDKNEYVDEYMVRYGHAIEQGLKRLNRIS